MGATLQVTFPRDGDILNRHDGRLEGGTLTVTVQGRATAGVPVTVNGSPAIRQGNTFTCAVSLTRPEETIRAEAEGEEASVRVLCDFHSRPRYRFSVDDNIEFLADLSAHPDRYGSLFDHWYLAFWRRMHDHYGAKIHLNLYYQTVDRRFNLSQLPTKWRDEWEANADWLHLSFHALQDQPPHPYRHGTYAQMAHDFELVMGEIRRFAGEAVTSRETTVHWASASREACRALVERGVDILIGLFFVEREEIDTAYYLDTETAEHIRTRDAWRDWSEKIIFVDCDWVVNNLRLGEIIPRLEERAADPHTGEMLELLIHEQYFRQESLFYQPEAQDKAERAIRWASEHGYEPCFWGEGFLGSPT